MCYNEENDVPLLENCKTNVRKKVKMQRKSWTMKSMKQKHHSNILKTLSNPWKKPTVASNQVGIHITPNKYSNTKWNEEKPLLESCKWIEKNEVDEAKTWPLKHT